MLHIDIQTKGTEPVYEQIATQLRQLIMDGLLEPGARLPSMRELSKQLQVSLNTVHAAIDRLTAENLVVTRRGSGSFVTDQLGIATGANLRTRIELRNDLSALPRMLWDAYAFQSDYFLVPPAPSNAQMIRFTQASPDPALYPFERIKQTVTNMLWNPRELFFDRGHPQGYLPLVEHLEKEMALTGIPMAEGENDILLTSGFQRALSIILRLLVQPGQQVAIEAPTYSAILNLLLAERIPYVPIPVDAEGMDTDYLAAKLNRGIVQAVVTIPTFHNPTGVSLSPERRQHLLRLAVQYRIPIIEDDWGRQLGYEDSLPPPLKTMDPGGYVIHIGTYSKSFLPGLRLGWVTCPSELAVTLLRAKLAADQGDSYFLQALMHEFIQRGHYARHLRHSLSEYRKRRNTLCRLLQQLLPAGCSFTTPQGGFSVWVKLPPELPSLPLLTLAREAGVEFLPAAYCMPQREDAPALRLAYSRTSVTDIERGIPLLCGVLANCLDNPALLKRGARSYKDLYK